MRATAIFGVFFFAIGSSLAHGQECPREDPKMFSIPSASQELDGQIVFHDGIRSWLGLRFEHAVCGTKEIELFTFSDDDATREKMYRLLETLRGCRATIRGKLDISPTAYYTTDIFDDIELARPASDCVPKAPFPDTSKALPKPSIRSYGVTLILDYGKDMPIKGVVRSSSRDLHPWQAYVNYFLNGEEDVTASCADGFRFRLLSSSRNAHAENLDNQVLAIAPETGDLRVILRYACTKVNEQPSQKSNNSHPTQLLPWCGREFQIKTSHMGGGCIATRCYCEDSNQIGPY